MDFTYFITVNKYRFCISVIGYINVQIIGIGYKKLISVDFFSDLHRTEGGLFHKTSLPNKPGLFQLVLF